MENKMENKIDEASRVDKEKFKRFQEFMINAIDEHMPFYGISWKQEEINKLDGDDYLAIRLNTKIEEYKLTKNTKKLISIANLAMLLYCKKELK